jgi:hypothetical protein
MQALTTLAYLKNGETFAQLGTGFGVGTTTARRYVNETVTSARSPELGRALAKARKDGLPYLVMDGTSIPIDRVKASRPFYSGKHKKHGMNMQAGRRILCNGGRRSVSGRVWRSRIRQQCLLTGNRRLERVVQGFHRAPRPAVGGRQMRWALIFSNHWLQFLQATHGFHR